ncbi:hypothetical protein B0T10DRAFT_468587 [Thelonectria olida]|uniref:Uncharacterized protein n=1 Tax=Thelonectria olida TaxID=1576542 RepID=A0A9P8WHT6_9HYPO|nr:hypothetical protein B0T10DRAFT_468587 [Thelonectria olida]
MTDSDRPTTEWEIRMRNPASLIIDIFLFRIILLSTSKCSVELLPASYGLLFAAVCVGVVPLFMELRIAKLRFRPVRATSLLVPGRSRH